MASTKFYLDTRTEKKDGVYPLKISVIHNRKTILIKCDVDLLPEQWDNLSSQIVNHPQGFLINTMIGNMKGKVDNLILLLMSQGELSGMTAQELKERIDRELNPIKANDIPKGFFKTEFLKFAKSKKPSTQELYLQTLKRITAYIGTPSLNRLKFESITKDWLVGFDSFMSLTSPSKNARNIHLRNIRAVFNEALDEGITTAYPFRRFKITPVATPKRSLKVEQLRTLFAIKPEPHAEKYLDMFKLIFFLIGINVIDLCNLKKIRDGRVEFYRSKTNRLYSIKVEPEAREIIDKYRGKGYLLDILDRYSNYKDYMHRLNENLQKLGPVDYGSQCRKMYHPIFPQLTTYWARHTWATIAASLDIPKDTIAAALGHGAYTVTDIYIDFDRDKIDEANRRVMDYVLYNK